jgi:hypothetical protein
MELVPAPRPSHTKFRAPTDPVLPGTPGPPENSSGGGTSVSFRFAISWGIRFGIIKSRPIMLLVAVMRDCCLTAGARPGGGAGATNAAVHCSGGRPWIESSGSNKKAATATTCSENETSVVQLWWGRFAQASPLRYSPNMVSSAFRCGADTPVRQIAAATPAPHSQSLVSKDTRETGEGRNSAKKKGRAGRGRMGTSRLIRCRELLRRRLRVGCLRLVRS